ncbi:hypothetical protein GCM10008018_08870 [Paenibacillus marchantiophytorum]|uniref:SCP2 domain-containing protein n=1 Tax=Paenibacillus marchantiophytorum TaxID=1619310 RepID=A0ABQ2BTP9_9BACL|nr:spore germination protein [Paenibacillus marchantiophytorum]GGI44793.1 hypothetical protein GCM10008018_08870 [Paenibacillus marchantiophytorum]
MNPVHSEIDIHTKEQELKEIFRNCSDITFRQVQIDGEIVIMMVYIDGLVNTDILDNALLKLSFEGVPEGLGNVETSGEALMQQILAVMETQVTLFLPNYRVSINGLFKNRVLSIRFADLKKALRKP